MKPPVTSQDTSPCQLRVDGHPFPGFEHPTANFLYCPNQFFDVCLPNYSRGVVRLVAFVLRKTLGWLDGEGNPLQQEIRVSYQDLIETAGVSRGAARQAIDQAIQGGFIHQTHEGNPSGRGVTAHTASFTLRWDDGSKYVQDPEQFAGFYAAEGHRTPIPNAFFDRVVSTETLAVLKVVGSVLRHTVGYQNQFGGRRSEAPLSYSYIQQYSNLRHRPTLAQALRQAIDRGYIRCVSSGCFDPRGGKGSRPAHYALNWREEAVTAPGSSKTEPATVQSRNRTGGSSRSEPENRFKNRTHRKTERKDTCKQHLNDAVVEEENEGYRLLRDAGFEHTASMTLSQSRGVDEIQRQLDWLPDRTPQQNPLGMLRRAIEEDWAAPVAAQAREREQIQRTREHEQDLREAAEQQRRDDHEAELRRKWFSLPECRRNQLRRDVIDNAHPRMRPWLAKQTIDRPVSTFLLAMEPDQDS